MQLFQKKSVLKKLSIREMWNLYRTLKYGLSDSPDDLFIDEIINIVDRIDTESFKSSLRIVYKDETDWNNKNSMELAFMFIDGLKINNLFGFVDFIKAMNGTSRR